MSSSILQNEDAMQIAGFARKYCWDMTSDEASLNPDRVILRTMDFGVLEDIAKLRVMLGDEKIGALIKVAPRGALRPRSLSYWLAILGWPDHTARDVARTPLRSAEP